MSTAIALYSRHASRMCSIGRTHHHQRNLHGHCHSYSLGSAVSTSVLYVVELLLVSASESEAQAWDSEFRSAAGSESPSFADFLRLRIGELDGELDGDCRAPEGSSSKAERASIIRAVLPDVTQAGRSAALLTGVLLAAGIAVRLPGVRRAGVPLFRRSTIESRVRCHWRHVVQD